MAARKLGRWWLVVGGLVVGCYPSSDMCRTTLPHGLSRAPKPPVEIIRQLQRRHPTDTLHNPRSGHATVRMRVLRDGRAWDVVVTDRSAQVFADACASTLRDSVWSPALDDNGQPVDYDFTLTCKFELTEGSGVCGSMLLSSTPLTSPGPDGRWP